MEVKCEHSKDKFGLNYLSKDINKATAVKMTVGPSELLLQTRNAERDGKRHITFSFGGAPSLSSLTAVQSH